MSALGQRRGKPGLTRDKVIADFPNFELPAALCEAGWWRREVEGFEEAAERAARFAGWLYRAGGSRNRRRASLSSRMAAFSICC